MSFRPSELPGGFERHCLRQIQCAHLFGNASADPSGLLAQAISSDTAYAELFSEQFEAVLERAVVLKPSEETEVVLAVKAELDRLYTVSASLHGEKAKIQEGLKQLISLTMQTIKSAAGDDPLAAKELEEEQEARTLHFKMLESSMVADLLNSHPDTGVFIPESALIPTLLSAEKSELADVIQLFDLEQALAITEGGEKLLGVSKEESVSRTSEADFAAATERLEFIRGYCVYLEDNA